MFQVSSFKFEGFEGFEGFESFCNGACSIVKVRSLLVYLFTCLLVSLPKVRQACFLVYLFPCS